MNRYNTYLKWLEVNDHRNRDDRIDRYMDWVCPLGYALAFGIVTAAFFVTN